MNKKKEEEESLPKDQFSSTLTDMLPSESLSMSELTVLLTMKASADLSEDIE